MVNNMAIIPKIFFDAVVAIGFINRTDIKWIGTGFLVGRKEVASDLYTIFLITNYHLVENKHEIIVRFNQKNANSCKDYRIELNGINGVNYSKHSVADLVAIQIAPRSLENNDSEFSWFALDKHVIDLNTMNETGVVEGNIVYSLGFPINMIGDSRKTPVCRIGCISRITDLFDNPESSEYLIDLQAIPGNSGAPVINRPENVSIKGTAHNSSANLIGIISGTIDYSEKCENADCPLEREKNSGFAIVHPVDAIISVVEQEYCRRRDLY